MIKAIFFDVGGVLVRDDSKRILDRQSSLLKVDRQHLITVMRPDRRLLMKGAISRSEYLRRVGKKLRTKRLSSLDLGQIFPASIVRHQQTWVIARRLWQRGYITGIITNVFPPHRFLPQVRLSYPPFRPIIRSYAVGAAKPERIIYDIARRRAKVKFSEMAFLDDREANVAAANKLGIKAFVYKNPAQLVRELRRRGVKI